MLQALLAAACLAAFGAPALAQAQAQPQAAPTAAARPIPDPWSGMNRAFYKFSMAVDHAVLAPIVHGYVYAVPQPVRTGLQHAIHNLDEPRIIGNQILQLRLKTAAAEGARFVVNSTVGIAGLFDPAADAGLLRQEADFGQTLGRYGVGTGLYIFVPFIGPTDVRDGLGRIVDGLGDPLSWASGGLSTTYSDVHDGLYVAQARVDIDDQLQGLRRDFTDPYATLRSAYSQNRAFMVDQARGHAGAPAVDSLPDFGSEPAPASPEPTPPAPVPPNS